MKYHYLLACLCVAYMSGARADIYKYVDEQGHVTYSSTPIKGGKKMNIEPLPTMKPQGGDFPSVSNAMQRNRDEERRRILQNELEAEQKLLAEARQKLADAEGNARVYHQKDGRTYRDVAGYEESVKAAQEDVAVHERNVSAINAELARIK